MPIKKHSLGLAGLANKNGKIIFVVFYHNRTLVFSNLVLTDMDKHRLTIHMIGKNKVGLL